MVKRYSKRDIWFLFYCEGINKWVFYRTNTRHMETSIYDQEVMEQYDVKVYYDPRQLQRVIDGLIDLGYIVQEVNVI